MTSKDLKDLLDGVAAEGRDLVDLDEPDLVRRIRTRRRRSRIIVTASGLATAAVIATAAVAVVPELRGQEPTVASDGGVSEASEGVSGLSRTTGCGALISGAPRSDAPVKLAATGPLTPAANPDFAKIDVQVTNTGATALDATTAQDGPDIVVVRDGVVVGTFSGGRDAARQVQLKPGETMTFEPAVSLRRCDAASAQTGQRLAAGSYQLYAVQTFRPTGGGEPVEVQGGPWPVDLK